MNGWMDVAQILRTRRATTSQSVHWARRRPRLARPGTEDLQAGDLESVDAALEEELVRDDDWRKVDQDEVQLRQESLPTKRQISKSWQKKNTENERKKDENAQPKKSQKTQINRNERQIHGNKINNTKIKCNTEERENICIKITAKHNKVKENLLELRKIEAKGKTEKIVEGTKK